MKDYLHRARNFILHDVWASDLTRLTGIRAVIKRILRVAELVMRGFREDLLPEKAAALTFTSLISLVPLLAIAFSLLKGLGAGDEFIARVQENTEVMPVEFQAFVQQMLDIVNRTNFRALGWVAVAVLFVTVVQVLSSIESVFNHIWGVSSARGILRRIINYTGIVVLVPVLILMAFAVNASLSSESVIARLGELAGLYRTLLQLAPFFSTALAIFLLFVGVPNTRIHVRPALISAIVTALMWVGWQHLYVTLQIGVARSNAIYGTFASVPIFLGWLYVSWVILLLGAELAFALQNHATYDLERSAGQANNRARVMLAYAIALQAGRAFQQGAAIFNAVEFAARHRIPIRLINELIRMLVRGGMMVETAGESGGYVLRRPLEDITLKQIVDLVNQDGAGPEKFGFGDEAAAVASAMERFDRGVDERLGQTTLRTLIDDFPVKRP